MKPRIEQLCLSRQPVRQRVAILCAVLMINVGGVFFAPPQCSGAVPAQDAARIPPDQLDSLVAPLALYPDQLLSQTLVASTYPLELTQLQQWLQKNGNLKDQALADAAAKQPWDASIQAMAAMPDLVKRLTDDIQWTTDLGNAFLAQQNDVMDAIQRMRQKAQGSGALQSNAQTKVETQQVEGKSVVVIEQADPQVVYVPSYNPTAVYGEPAYPYPSIYYPAARAISWGVGLAMGAAWGGGWGWGAGWGNNNININRNNNFVRNTNISGNTWNHNPQHRGGTPYPNRSTANKFGGPARGDSLANRQSKAGQQIGQQGANASKNRSGAGSAGNRASTGGAGNRPSTGGAGNKPTTGVLGDRATAPSAPGKADTRASAGRSNPAPARTTSTSGGDRIGSRDIPSSSSSGSRSAFGAGSGSFNGSQARASSSRGASSAGASRGGAAGGGAARSGGGASRGGGGGRRR